MCACMHMLQVEVGCFLVKGVSSMVEDPAYTSFRKRGPTTTSKSNAVVGRKNAPKTTTTTPTTTEEEEVTTYKFEWQRVRANRNRELENPKNKNAMPETNSHH